MSGLLYIVAAPSGAGKSSLVNAVLAADARLRLSVSHTTRAPRAGEQNGREYFFVDVARFEEMRAAGDFLEHAFVHGNWYGTSKAQIEAARTQDQDVVLEIDWQGARQVRAVFPDAVSVFILPPSMQVLEQRLRTRATDSEAAIARRLAAASSEIAHAGEFEYAIINNDFGTARDDLAAVFRATRLMTARQRVVHAQVFAGASNPN